MDRLNAMQAFVSVAELARVAKVVDSLGVPKKGGNCYIKLRELDAKNVKVFMDWVVGLMRG